MSSRCLFVCALALLGACATPTIPVRRGTTTPHAIAAICLGPDGVPIPLDDTNCTDATSNMRAIVSGIDSVGCAMPAERTWLDVDESTPGFTPLHMPGFPGAVAIDPLKGQGYVAIPLLNWVVRVDLTQLINYKFTVLDWQDVGVETTDMLIVQTPEPRLYMADATNGRVVWIPLTTFGILANGAPVPSHAIDVGGTPASLTFSPLNLHIYVGHLSAGFISVIDTGSSIAEPALLKQISIVAQCRNGLDDDGDGKTDGDDSGCDGPDDRFEGNPELALAGNCTNGVDDDGDGETDAQDPGCAITPTTLVDACRNGIDDDGDGLTDYSPGGSGDPGCSGWGDNTEWSEQVICATPGPGCKTVAAGVSVGTTNLCGDGIDNDGDGLTDAADPDCHVLGNAVEGPPACADGIDNDGDGTTDLADPDCYNRASLAEISNATALRTVVAATFDGQFVVVADRTRRALLVIDTQKDELIQPVPGQDSPFLRASRLDLRDGIVGLSLADVPISLAPVNYTDIVVHGDQSYSEPVPQMAIGLAQIGVEFLQFYKLGTDTGVSIDIVQTPEDPPVDTTLTAGRPLLLIPGQVLDLPTTIPTRFAAFGSSLSTDANNNTVYYGLAPTTDYADQRAETWRFTREGELPNGVGEHGRVVTENELHDPTMNFCEVGVLPGDMLQIPVATTCQGGGTFDFTVTAVHADRLEFDSASGVLDVPVTYDNQLTYDASARKPFTSQLRDCVVDGAVAYTLRAGTWLVWGSRSLLPSMRLSADGECLALAPADQQASRVPETHLLPGKTTADVIGCPYADEPLDPTVWQIATYVHPSFTAVLSPGCDSSIFDANGDPIINLVPSIREAEWVYGVTAGSLPRTTAAGANPVAMASGQQLSTLYVVDEGAGLLQFVNIPDGTLLDTPLD